MASRLAKILTRQMSRAIRDWDMIGPGDRVMVGVSGGKDSLTLLQLLRHMQRRAPFEFSVIAVTLDQAQPGFPVERLRSWYEEVGAEYRIVFRDTYSIVKEKVPEGKTYCALCSRLRRGILYNVAVELGATKIALGHHREDLNETLLLNLFYSGQLKTMSPRLTSDDGRNTVIRPMAYCAEADIAAYATEQAFPIIPCNLCGTQENLHREKMKALIDTLSAENPNVRGSMLTALSNVKSGHLLDRTLHEQLGMELVGKDETLEALGGAPCGAVEPAPAVL